MARGIAVERGGAHLFGPGERPEREDQCGQQAVKRSLGQRAG
jgi:hypothetical protein